MGDLRNKVIIPSTLRVPSNVTYSKMAQYCNCVIILFCSDLNIDHNISHFEDTKIKLQTFLFPAAMIAMLIFDIPTNTVSKFGKQIPTSLV